MIAAVALCLAACSSLPVLVPDMAGPRASKQVLLGVKGALSAAQSKLVLARLAQQAPGTEPTSIFTRHLAVEDAIVGSPLTVGNSVTLLQDGPATYQAMLGSIEGARQHIHMQTYIFDDDEVGQRFAQALSVKAEQGVQVRLMHDSVGTLGTPAAFFDGLRVSGVQVVEFNPVNPLLARKGWELNQRDHRKLLVVDGSTAFLGGINISSVYSGGSLLKGSRASGSSSPPWRDTHLQLQGPVVGALQTLFLEAWASQRGPAVDAGSLLQGQRPGNQKDVKDGKGGKGGNEVVRAIGSSPEDPYSLIYVTLLSAIASAETSVQITMAYFVPDPQLLTALTDAAARGVTVQLILPSKTDFWLVLEAGRRHYAALLQAGVQIFERRGAVLHAKTAVIDGVWSTVGSTNLDWRSFLHNYELNAVVLGQGFGSQMQAFFAADLALSDRVLPAVWQQRPLHRRLKEQFARAWEYWL